MIRQFLLAAARTFRRQPVYAILNLLGLTIGMTATLLVLLYIAHESRFDQYHTKVDNIYRVSAAVTEPDDAFRWSVTQSPLAPTLKEEFPEVEEYVRFLSNGRTRLEYEDKFFFEEKIFLVDSTVCDVFSFDFVQGDGAKALIKPNSIALSTSVAKRIFGSQNPIGKAVKTPSGREYEVTGVYRDMPANSHLIANAMISSNSIPQFNNPTPGAWGNFSTYNYVLLKEGTDLRAFENKLSSIVEKHVAVIFDQFDIKVKYEVIALADIHLKSQYEGEPEPLGEMGFLYIFGAVGVFMLLLACINYMNLSTARATKRSMEVGIKKVLGSDRSQLIRQFLGESIAFALLALVLSYLLALLILPVFNDAFDLQLHPSLLLSKPVLFGILGIILLTGILGGSYPAFYLSGFQPIGVLKGSLGKGSGNPTLRKTLVAIQFAITIFMLAGTGVIYDQMQYLRSKHLGFDKENVMTLSLQGREARTKYPVLREKLLDLPSITKVGSASVTPGQGPNKQVMNVQSNEGTMDQYGIDNYAVDFDFFSTLNIEVVQGRNFNREFGTDSTLAVLVNESMVKRMGWADPIGQGVQLAPVDTLPIARVIGVVKDFHQTSLYDPISSLMFLPRFNNSQVHVRFQVPDANSLNGLIRDVERSWQAIFPNQPFEYEFMDASFMELYRADQIRARIFSLFSVLMIIIAGLGLLGLASFTAEQRTKEIGIRKVVGAQNADIVLLLTRSFIYLVLIAALPAFLAAWFFMHKWLDTFAYHTNMNYWLYGLALGAVLLIVFITTGYHALKAAIGNPVEALRNE